jgi:hypothetical protein
MKLLVPNRMKDAAMSSKILRIEGAVMVVRDVDPVPAIAPDKVTA